MERAAKVEPFTLLELTLRYALVAALSKPRWWRKWRDAEIRRKWLDELELILLQQTLEQSLKWEPSDDEVLGALQEIVASAAPEERDAQLTAWFKRVRNDPWEQWPPKDEEEEEEEVDGDDDANDGDDKDVSDSSEEEKEEEDEEEDEFQEKRPNAYVYIVWFFTRVVLRERCVPADGSWDLDKLRAEIRIAEARSDPTVAPRALAFIRSVVGSGATNASVRAALQGIESRAKTLAELRKRCKAIRKELARARAYVAQVLDEVAANKKMLLRVDSGDQGDGDDQQPIATPAGVHGTWICDHLVPDSLKTVLVEQVAVLEDVPEEAKDWHPNSNQQVLDLVHPSLYCCVFGTTKQVSPPVDPESCADAAEHMQRITGGASTLVTSAFQGSTSFQWIPSEFRVADDGSVRILSYVNNVHPARHRELYGALESIFARFVPLFERTLSALTASFPRPVFNWPQDYNEDRPRFPKKVTIPFDTADASAVSLKGRRVQVIVKIAEIVLTPETPAYAGGTWHIEGTAAEQIVATGIYYFACENIADSRLAFRVSVDEPAYEQSDNAGVAVTFGLFNDELLVQPLGAVAAVEDRCLVFPNVVQHKVEPFELADRSKPGVRKILAFFLVDPEKAIPSTATIPPQQHEWVDEIQRPLLKKIKLVDAAQDIVEAMAGGDTMTLAQAKEHRLALMSERSALSEPSRDDTESYFSLCEH